MLVNSQITLPFYTRVSPNFTRFSCGFGPGLAARPGPGQLCTAAQGVGQARQPKLATRVSPYITRLITVHYQTQPALLPALTRLSQNFTRLKSGLTVPSPYLTRLKSGFTVPSPYLTRLKPALPSLSCHAQPGLTRLYPNLNQASFNLYQTHYRA